MLDKSGQAGCQCFRQARLAWVIERASQQQRPGIVIDAIAMVTVGHAMDRMLEEPGIVAHGQKMAEAHLRCSVAAVRRHALARPRNHPRPVPPPSAFERGKVAFGVSLPCHAPAARIGALAHRLALGIVGQQRRDLATDSSGIAKGHQYAASVCQQFPCVPIGR